MKGDNKILINKLILSELILDSILKQMSKHMSLSELQRIIDELTRGKLWNGIKVNAQRIDFVIPERKIFQDDKKFTQAIKSISKIICSLYDFSIKLIGTSQTNKVFNNAMKEVKKKNINFSILNDIIRSLPQGIFEEEKFRFLSRRELEHRTKKLMKIQALRSDFTNITAHELKSPISPLKGFLILMKQDPKKYGLNKIGQEYIDMCLISVERLEQLVNDVLDISKLESNEMKFYMKNINLKEIIQDQVISFLPYAKQKRIYLKAKIPEYLPQIYADPDRISQVISNLIRNALKFTDKGGVNVIVKVVGNNIQVSVIDTGIGIDKGDVSKLFHKFFQTRESMKRKERGTGLGLSICKKIIESHNGKIFAKSEGLGKGTTITFTLPIKNKKKQ